MFTPRQRKSPKVWTRAADRVLYFCHFISFQYFQLRVVSTPQDGERRKGQAIHKERELRGRRKAMRRTESSQSKSEGRALITVWLSKQSAISPVKISVCLVLNPVSSGMEKKAWTQEVIPQGSPPCLYLAAYPFPQLPVQTHHCSIFHTIVTLALAHGNRSPLRCRTNYFIFILEGPALSMFKK